MYQFIQCSTPPKDTRFLSIINISVAMDVPIKLGTYDFNITLVLEVFQDDCFCCCEPAKLNNSLVILKEEQSSMFLSRKSSFLRSEPELFCIGILTFRVCFFYYSA